VSLRLFSDAAGFGEALAASTAHLYSICNRDRLDPAELIELERRAAGRGQRDLLDAADLRAHALREIEQFFREAARFDPKWRFAYSSKVVLAVPEYQDLQKIFLLRAALARKPDAHVLMLIPEPRLRHLFAELFCEAREDRDRIRPRARGWQRCARTLLRAIVNRAVPKPARVLVFTLATGAPRSANDAYFGDFAQHLDRHAPTLTVYLASGPDVRLPADSDRVPFETFVSAVDVVFVWCAAYVSAIHAASNGLPADDLAALHRYIRGAEIRSGEFFMQRLYERGFERMVKRVAPDILLYPFENRSFEKHLVAIAARRGVKRRIGYQHSSITPRHLAFHLDESEVRAEHLPDRVVTIGDVSTAILREIAPPLARRVETGVSLRTARQPVSDARVPAVLVAISSSRNEALRLLQVTHAAAARVGLRFIVRTHPTIPIADMYALFDWPAHVELSSGRSLADDLSKATLVAYSSSTVALEGMLYGRLAIFVDIGDLPDGDPISGAHAFKLTARDGETLAHAADSVLRLEPAALDKLRDEARDYAERYLSAPTSEAVERMAQSVLAA
jgi:hypothetical protein